MSVKVRNIFGFTMCFNTVVEAINNLDNIPFPTSISFINANGELCGFIKKVKEWDPLIEERLCSISPSYAKVKNENWVYQVASKVTANELMRRSKIERWSVDELKLELQLSSFKYIVNESELIMAAWIIES